MRDVVLSHLTIGGSPLETVRAARAGGFAAAGVRICGRRPDDPFPGSVVGSAAATRALRDELDGSGVRLASVNALQFYPDIDWDRLGPIVECAAALAAPKIIANVFDEGPRFLAVFRRFCAVAAEAGIAVALEFLPYSRVRGLATTRELIADLECSNVGLLVDALHLERSGGRPADLKVLRADEIAFAQLCDAMASREPQSDAQLMQQARTARLELGEGELPLHEFVECMPDSVELEYEVVRADLAGAPFEEKARAARADVRRFLAAHETRRQSRCEVN